MTWSARPYNNNPRTKSPRSPKSPHKTTKSKRQDEDSAGRSRKHEEHPEGRSKKSTPEPVFTIKDDNQIEEAIKLIAAEMALTSGFCSKEELRKVIKKRLKKQAVSKEHISATVQRAMESVNSKARADTTLHRDRVFNTLTRLFLKQYEGLSQGNRDLLGGLEDLESCVVCEDWCDDHTEETRTTPRSQSKRYKKGEFQAEYSKLEAIRSEGERVCLQLRQLTDVMEQTVFDLERNIHQQNLYLSLA